MLRLLIRLLICISLVSPANAGSMTLLGVGGPSAGAPAFTPQGVLFDSTATANWSHTTAQFTGLVDSQVGTFSAWIFFPVGAGGDVSVFDQNFGSGGSQTILNWSSVNGYVQTILTNSAGTNLMFKRSAAALIAKGSWHQVLISWDLSVPKVQMYIDDVVDSTTPLTLTTGTINYTSTGAQWFFNDPIGGVNNMAVADVWFDPTAFMDFSVTANRRKFISGAGAAVFLGASGQLPTGASPISFNTGPFGGWNTNLGTGGNYTQGSGTLAASATNPP